MNYKQPKTLSLTLELKESNGSYLVSRAISVQLHHPDLPGISVTTDMLLVGPDQKHLLGPVRIGNGVQLRILRRIFANFCQRSPGIFPNRDPLPCTTSSCERGKTKFSWNAYSIRNVSSL